MKISKCLGKSLAIGAAMLALSTGAYGGDVEAGRAKSATCAACHGPTGVSVNPLWPNIAGQQEAYLVKQITAFRDGDRTDINMNAMVASLSDEDIADLAAFFAAQGCE